VHELLVLPSLTVAVNVTLCPYTDPLGTAPTVVVLAACPTACASVPVAPLWLLSPP
jgi:hypothetical protein